MQAERFYAHGKLLLTAEYLVLHGATALALPTRQGQWLEARPTENGELWWQAFDEHDQRWLEVRLRLPDLHILQSTDAEAALRLQQLLQAAERHKPGCVRQAAGWLVQTRLEFNRHWGLGSSSSLVSLLAQWLQLDAFAFYFATQTGSGYDLACATATGPVLYTRESPQPRVQSVRFNPPFAHQLRWVYLGQKQNSLREVKSYLRSGKSDDGLLREVSDLTRSILTVTDLEGFSSLLAEHENLIGQALGRKTVGETQFAGYPGQAKSLGAWGGDFVLLCLPEPEACLQWLANNHFETVLSYDTLV
ncbi:MAG: GHMP kinase [Sphingobacteriaceae bacterium]|nr:GHMP kinase [Sphingobacteriaceae bacterium]